MRERRNAKKGLTLVLCLTLCISLFVCNMAAYAEDNAAEQPLSVAENSETSDEPVPKAADEGEKVADDRAVEISEEESGDDSNDQIDEAQSGNNENARTIKEPLGAVVAGSVERNGVITKIDVLLENGSGPVTGGVGQWQVMQLNAEFALPNNTIKSGDTTTVALPEELRFYKTDKFPIADEAGNVIANAVADGTAKTLTLTYKDYPETHSNVSGNFHFYVRIDRNVVTEERDIPLVFDVSGETIIGGTIHYNGPRNPTPRYIGKSGEQSGSRPNELTYQLNINTVKADIRGVVVTDSIETTGVTYIKDTLKIGKGRWEAVNGDWWFMDEIDVTNDYDIDWSEDGTSFSVNLGDISSAEGFQIKYRAKSNYDFADGERIRNAAQITGSNIAAVPVSGDITYHEGGGSGEGYVYGIRVIKKDMTGNTLPGAEFDIIRIATGAKVGTITTDSTGEGSLSGLLQDEYRLVETRAPNGYKMLNDPVDISVSDFGSDKIAVITVENEPDTISIPVVKQWVGAPADNVTIRLLADGTEIDSVNLTTSINWEYTFSNLPVYAKDGRRITYTISEDIVEGYTSAIAEDDEKGFIITNTKDDPPEVDTPEQNDNNDNIDNNKNTNTGKSSSGSPKTGDTNNLAEYAAVLMASISMLVIIALRRKRNDE